MVIWRLWGYSDHHICIFYNTAKAMIKFTHELNGKLLDMSFCVSTSNVVGCGYHLPCEKKTLPNIENKKVYKQKSQSYIEDQIISYNLNNRAYSPILKTGAGICCDLADLTPPDRQRNFLVLCNWQGCLCFSWSVVFHRSVPSTWCPNLDLWPLSISGAIFLKV